MIVLLSGEVAAGKSSAASALEEQYGYRRVRSGSYLAEVARNRGLTTDRHGLQKMGDLLDQETKGAWIAELAQNQISEIGSVNRWVLDSVRRDFQIFRFRELFPTAVIHVHLMAADSMLNARFQARAQGDDRDSGADYSQVKASETEQHAKSLGTIADISVSSGTFRPDQIAQLIDMIAKLQAKEARE